MELRKVTWYSQLVAIILFVGVFTLGFYLGGLSKIAEAPIQTGTTMVDDIIAKAHFSCPDGKSMDATFRNHSVDLKLSDGRVMISLLQTISASGARYANSDESFVFWNKGKGAFITEGERTTYTDCVTP